MSRESVACEAWIPRAPSRRRSSPWLATGRPLRISRIASRRASAEGMSGYQCPDAAIGEELGHHAVRGAPVDDVHGAHAARESLQHRLRLDVHPPLDALAEPRLEVGRLDLGEQVPPV